MRADSKSLNEALAEARSEFQRWQDRQRIMRRREVATIPREPHESLRATIEATAEQVEKKLSIYRERLREKHAMRYLREHHLHEIRAEAERLMTASIAGLQGWVRDMQHSGVATDRLFPNAVLYAVSKPTKKKAATRKVPRGAKRRAAPKGKSEGRNLIQQQGQTVANSFESRIRVEMEAACVGLIHSWMEQIETDAKNAGGLVEPDPEGARTYPNRASWLKTNLKELGWWATDPGKWEGPDPKTVRKMLAGSPVSDNSIDRLLESFRVGGKLTVRPQDVPDD